MYAIVATDGRQLKLEAGQEVFIDQREAEAGATLTLDQVLAVRDDSGLKLGRPKLENASVELEVLGDAKGPKLHIQKFRRRKNSRTHTGHRQKYTKARVTKINAG